MALRLTRQDLIIVIIWWTGCIRGSYSSYFIYCYAVLRQFLIRSSSALCCLLTTFLNTRIKCNAHAPLLLAAILPKSEISAYPSILYPSQPSDSDRFSNNCIVIVIMSCNEMWCDYYSVIIVVIMRQYLYRMSKLRNSDNWLPAAWRKWFSLCLGLQVGSSSPHRDSVTLSHHIKQTADESGIRTCVCSRVPQSVPAAGWRSPGTTR